MQDDAIRLIWRHPEQVAESGALRKLAAGRCAEIRLIEHRRAHNICIELAGIRLPFAAIKACPHAHMLLHVGGL